MGGPTDPLWFRKEMLLTGGPTPIRANVLNFSICFGVPSYCITKKHKPFSHWLECEFCERAPLWVGCGGFSLLHRLRRCQPSFWQITTISLNWSEYHILWSSLSCKGKKSLFPVFNFWNLFCLSYIWPLLCPEGRPGLQVSRHSGFWTFRVLDDGWIVWNGQRHKHKKRSRNRMCPTQNIQNVR